MHRRTFLQWSAAVPATATILASAEPDAPTYRVVSPYKSNPPKGMPGQVVDIRSDKCIDESNEKVDPKVVADMIARGMCALTGEKKAADAWRRFFVPSDVVGIKVNCSGAPKVCSNPYVVAEIARNLTAIGIPAKNIWVYERFDDQLESVNYNKYMDQPVNLHAVEVPRGSIRNYDPKVYAEVNFFGEEDTRSFLIRHVSETFTKIINVPNMKDHGASGVTGCLKNIAYGNFSNVARSHRYEKTNTKTFIGVLAQIEPLRSKTVLNIMDGLKGVWHGGPFAQRQDWVFYPKRMMFGTDMVAMDRLLIDIIEDKRKEKGAVSVWDRSREHLMKGRNDNPLKNRFIREPGHIEYASTLGLGLYDKSKIKLEEIAL
jgi:uncharacterized protein (DUF362 family)